MYECLYFRRKYKHSYVLFNISNNMYLFNISNNMIFNTSRITTFNVNDHKQFRQKDDYLVLSRKHIFAATIILFWHSNVKLRSHNLYPQSITPLPSQFSGEAAKRQGVENGLKMANENPYISSPLALSFLCSVIYRKTCQLLDIISALLIHFVSVSSYFYEKSIYPFRIGILFS